MTLLRNKRGRIRCFYDDCRHWASYRVLTATEWSVAAKVPMCGCCANQIKQYGCEGAEETG